MKPLVNISKRHFPRNVFSLQEAKLGLNEIKNPFLFSDTEQELMKVFNDERLPSLPNFVEHTQAFEVFLKDYDQASNQKFDLSPEANMDRL